MRLYLIFLIIIAAESRGGRPRVYNALISTNQELLPSRAYPAVSPVIGQPVYLTSSVEFHHKEQHVETQQPYQQAPFQYQEQEIEQNNYDSYDDHQFQGYGSDGHLEEEEHSLIPDSSQSEGHISQDVARPPAEPVRMQQEVARHSARSPAFQEQGRRPFQRPRHHPPQEEHWEEEEPALSPPPSRRPVQRAQPETRNRPSKVAEIQPPSQPGRPGKPPLLSEFHIVGGIPLNNQPGNIPVVLPPPIPIRLKD